MKILEVKDLCKNYGNGVNWKLVYEVFAGWIITIFICALSTGLVVWLALHFLSICTVCSTRHFGFQDWSRSLSVFFLKGKDPDP